MWEIPLAILNQYEHVLHVREGRVCRYYAKIQQQKAKAKARNLERSKHFHT